MSHVADPIIIIPSSGSNPIGPASGDLSGNYPAPQVVRINGALVPLSGSLVTGNILQVNGSSSLTYDKIDLSNSNSIKNILPISNLPNLSGDVSGIINNNTVLNINGASVPASGGLITGNGLYVDGPAKLKYSALNLAGGSNYVMGLLPVLNQSNQIMNGDVSGTTATSTVIKLQNKNLSSSNPNDKDVLTWDGLQWIAKPIPPPTSFGITAFGCFSSNVIQNATLANTSYIWTYNTTEIANNISITNNLLGQPTRITVAESGIYEIAFSPQLNKTGGTPATTSIWAIQNNNIVPRSTSTTDVGGNLNTQLPFVSIFFSMNAGDYVEFAFSSTSIGTSIIAIPEQINPNRPAAPSVIIVAKRISAKL